MKIKDFFIESGRSMPGNGTDPVKSYIQYIKSFTGDEEVVDFCFDAMMHEVDFKRGEAAQWSQVAPDYGFIRLFNYQSKLVNIPLPETLKTSFKKARANSTSTLVFDQQYALLVKVGAIILFATGHNVYDLKNFDRLHTVRKEHLQKNALPHQKPTRLCMEPWNNFEVGLKGEVFPCSQLPAIWSIEQPEALFAGISRLQESLLSGEPNHFCRGCNAKSPASIPELKAQIGSDPAATCNLDIFKKMVAHKTAYEKIPIPPAHLRFRISGTADDKIFVHNGIVGSEQIMSYVEKYDDASVRSLLDWGCGCGRYAHHITSKWPKIAYTGCDIDEEAISWCQTNLKQGNFVTTPAYPPTPFVNEQFTSVIASSVMTHLTKENQQLWLREIYRILQPEGIFIASVLGITAASQIRWLAWKLKRKDFIDYHQDMALKGIAPEGYYRDVFQTEAYTRKKWSALFDIKEYVPAGLMGYQDLVILQKK